MKAAVRYAKVTTFLLATRPKFLVASAAPVLVGSVMGYATAGTFQPLLFILALLAIMFLNAGANVTNDYFDHLSRNDWLNQNPTPFSGGRRYIQQGIISPNETMLVALLSFGVGSVIGVGIVLLTKSIFVLVLGLAGTLGGYFYTARPLKLGYRSFGELVIMLLFGLLPVYGAYYLQTTTIDLAVLGPAAIVGIWIFLVILVNEFPDIRADAAVNKRTLVVRFGVPAAVWIYRGALLCSFVIAALMLIKPLTFFAGLFYLFTLPVAVSTIRCINEKDLSRQGHFRGSQITIVLHAVGCLSIIIGLLAYRFLH